MSRVIIMLVSVALIVGLLWFLLVGHSTNKPDGGDVSNVTISADGIQRISLLARGGYRPRKILAQANRDTILQVETQGTYDCSSSMVIPAIGYRDILPATGMTEIEISASQATGTLQILCSMGMYRSTIVFE